MLKTKLQKTSFVFLAINLIIATIFPFWEYVAWNNRIIYSFPIRAIGFYVGYFYSLIPVTIIFLYLIILLIYNLKSDKKSNEKHRAYYVVYSSLAVLIIVFSVINKTFVKIVMSI